MKKFLYSLLVLMFIASCSTQKKVPYFQDLRNGGTVEVALPQEITIKPADKLSIYVNSKDEELVAPFNLRRSQQSMASQGDLAYTVDKDGCIEFPYLGSIRVEGMTRDDVAKHIRQELLDRKMVQDPTVIVNLNNLQISVLGDVSKPGKYSIEKDKFTIIDAITEAGDLAITGKRDNVMVLREENGEQKTYFVNLNDASQLFASPVYYLQQDDIVYVEPNSMKSGQSSINSNTLRSTSFWFSAVSLVLTLITFFTR